jgi:hypothetical protein
LSYWSIACVSKETIIVPEAKAILEPGVNVFTVVIDDLDKLIERLASEGVTVSALHRLDVHEAVDAATLLPAEDPGLLSETDGSPSSGGASLSRLESPPS